MRGRTRRQCMDESLAASEFIECQTFGQCRRASQGRRSWSEGSRIRGSSAAVAAGPHGGPKPAPWHEHVPGTWAIVLAWHSPAQPQPEPPHRYLETNPSRSNGESRRRLPGDARQGTARTQPGHSPGPAEGPLDAVTTAARAGRGGPGAGAHARPGKPPGKPC